MTNFQSGYNAYIDPRTPEPSASRGSTNASGSQYVSNPYSQYPLVTNPYNGNVIPRGQHPDPNLDVGNVFSNENRGGGRKSRRAKKSHRRKSRRHRRKTQRRRHR